MTEEDYGHPQSG